MRDLEQLGAEDQDEGPPAGRTREIAEPQPAVGGEAKRAQHGGRGADCGAATRVTTPWLRLDSLSASRTIRTARSRISGGYRRLLGWLLLVVFDVDM